MTDQIAGLNQVAIAKQIFRNAFIPTLGYWDTLGKDIPLEDTRLAIYQVPVLRSSYFPEGDMVYVADSACILIKEGLLDKSNFNAANLPDVTIRGFFRHQHVRDFYCHINNDGLAAIGYNEIAEVGEAALAILNATNHISKDGPVIGVLLPGEEGFTFSYNKKLADEGDIVHSRAQNAFEMLIKQRLAFDIPKGVTTLAEACEGEVGESGLVRFKLSGVEVQRLNTYALQYLDELFIARMGQRQVD